MEDTPKVKIVLEMSGERLLAFLRLLKKHDKELFELFAKEIKKKINPEN